MYLCVIYLDSHVWPLDFIGDYTSEAVENDVNISNFF